MADKIYGIDWSGSKNAGDKIWITRAVIDSKEKLMIERVFTASELFIEIFGLRYYKERKKLESSIKIIEKLIIDDLSDDSPFCSIFGFDFPFSLPMQLFRITKLWEDMLHGVFECFETPEDFRSFCKLNSDREYKRQTDIESKTPFSPYNLRIYRQTFYGIRMLVNLVKKDYARIIPMQQGVTWKPRIVEVCPASTLKKCNIYFPYKGKDKKFYDARKKILKEIPITINHNIADRIIEDTEGDAIDSLISAIAVYLNYNKILNDKMFEENKIYKYEGYVYL